MGVMKRILRKDEKYPWFDRDACDILEGFNYPAVRNWFYRFCNFACRRDWSLIAWWARDAYLFCSHCRGRHKGSLYSWQPIPPDTIGR